MPNPDPTRAAPDRDRPEVPAGVPGSSPAELPGTAPDETPAEAPAEIPRGSPTEVPDPGPAPAGGDSETSGLPGARGTVAGQGRTGGRLARDLGTRDELKRATERPAGATRVRKSDAPGPDGRGGGGA